MGSPFAPAARSTKSAPLAPADTYAATKAAADLAIGALAVQGLHAVRFRPFNHTGPGQSEDFVVAAFAAQLARIEAGQQPPVVRVGRLDPARDFLDVRDVVAAYVACLARPERLPPGTILNLASGHCRPIRAVLEDLIALAGLRPRIEEDAARLRPTEIPAARGSAAAAASLLGWQPSIPWERTLRDVLDYWRAEVAGLTPPPSAASSPPDAPSDRTPPR